MRDSDWTETGIRILIVAILLGIVFICICCQNNEYNNGIHKGCGGHLVYQQAVGHRYQTYYIFKCDKCGEMFEFDSLAIDDKEMYHETEATK